MLCRAGTRTKVTWTGAYSEELRGEKSGGAALLIFCLDGQLVAEWSAAWQEEQRWSYLQELL